MMTISQSTISLAIALLYLVIGFAVFRRFIPQLGPNSKRLTIGLLLSQVALVGLAHYVQPSSRFEQWLWNLDMERNIVSMLSTAQMALVGGGALFISWSAQSRPAWQRIAFACIGLVFVYFAWDEYHGVRAFFSGWQVFYAALGLAVAAATVLLARRSPRRVQRWYLLFLVGLALSGSGAIILDRAPQECNVLAHLPVKVDGCLYFPALEEVLEMLGIWLALVAICGLAPRLDPNPRRLHSRQLILIGLLSVAFYSFPFWFTNLDMRLFAKPANIGFASDIYLRAYRAQLGADKLDLKLFFSGPSWHTYSGLGYSIHLVDQASGESIAAMDEFFTRRFRWRVSIADLGVNVIQWVQLPIAPEAPANRALWLVLRLWREKSGEYVPLTVRASDHRLLSNSQVALGEHILSAPQSGDSALVPLAKFENGVALDNLHMPEIAHSGETFDITFFWRSNADGLGDYMQFLHFGHIESGEWWVYDQQPLGSRLPTRLWYKGLADNESWAVPLPPSLMSGEYALFTGLYRESDNERLPVSSADGSAFVDFRVPLGLLSIENAA